MKDNTSNVSGFDPPDGEAGMVKTNRKSKTYWSGEVTRESNALDLEQGVFTWSDPVRIARSLARSAKESTRKKATPFQSAMSMLNFYINRAGKHLPAKQKGVLEQTKIELKKIFKKE